MQRSPVNKQAPTYGSAPDVSQLSDREDDLVTVRSSKRRRRCDCDCGSNYESKLDKFINSLTDWKNTSEGNIADIKTGMKEIQHQNSEIIATNVEIKKSVESLSAQYEDLSAQLSQFKLQTTECLERVTKVEEKTEELHRASRAAHIELRNIPHKINSSQEELLEIATRTLMGLSIQLTAADVFDIHHISTKSDHKTIVVALSSVLTKNKILKAYRDHNKAHPSNKLNTSLLGAGVPQVPIYISEHLTPSARRLHYLAREFASKEQYKYCWTSGGRVLLRKDDAAKHIIVSSEAQLTALQS